MDFTPGGAKVLRQPQVQLVERDNVLVTLYKYLNAQMYGKLFLIEKLCQNIVLTSNTYDKNKNDTMTYCHTECEENVAVGWVVQHLDEGQERQVGRSETQTVVPGTKHTSAADF